MATIQCGPVRFSDIQAVIFDKDGTLANSWDYLRNLAQKRARLIDAQIPGVQEPLLMAFGADGDRLNPAGLTAVATRRETAIAAAAYIAETGRDWVEALAIAQSAFEEADQVFKRKADHTPVFAGVAELLHGLSLPIVILSSDTTANVQDFVDRYELGAIVTRAIGVDAGPSKPDPEVLRRACAAIGRAPAEVLVVGDAAVDIQMAKAAGAAGSVGVTWGGISAAALRSADVVIAHPSDMQRL